MSERYFNEFKPTEVLDKLLGFLYEQSEALSDFEVRSKFRRKTKIIIDTESKILLNKLQQDGYVSYKLIPPAHGKAEEFLYYITLEGQIYHWSGGYSQSFLEKERLEKLEKKQEEQHQQLIRLNWFVAIGTAIASAYSIVEILKTFGTIAVNK